MKKKIMFWAPCLNKVGTLKSTIYSTISLSRYFNDKYEVSIINSCGEWNDYVKIFEKEKIKVIDLGYNYFNYLPKTGFIFSRISYCIIFVLSFFSLIKNIKKYNPDFLIASLITSLPLIIQKIFNFRLKLILYISGHPKINFIRFLFWNFVKKIIFLVLFPTRDLKTSLKNKFIFDKNKCCYLPNAIISINDFKNKVQTIDKINFNNKFFLAVGRLTTQKNFFYLIKEFYQFSLVDKDYSLVIIGEGEDRVKLQNLINQNNISDRVYLLGYKENVYFYMKKAHALILTSLWEDPGFVLVEAALSNLFIISSNCPNGPKEILANGEAGYLFSSNKKDELLKQLIKFKNNNHSIYKMKILAKKNAMKYTLFRHGNEFNKILLS